MIYQDAVWPCLRMLPEELLFGMEEMRTEIYFRVEHIFIFFGQKTIEGQPENLQWCINLCRGFDTEDKPQQKMLRNNRDTC